MSVRKKGNGIFQEYFALAVSVSRNKDGWIALFGQKIGQEVRVMVEKDVYGPVKFAVMDRRRAFKHRKADRKPDYNHGLCLRVDRLRVEFLRHPRQERRVFPVFRAGYPYQGYFHIAAFLKDVFLQVFLQGITDEDDFFKSFPDKLFLHFKNIASFPVNFIVNKIQADIV